MKYTIAVSLNWAGYAQPQRAIGIWDSFEDAETEAYRLQKSPDNRDFQDQTLYFYKVVPLNA